MNYRLRVIESYISRPRYRAKISRRIYLFVRVAACEINFAASSSISQIYILSRRNSRFSCGKKIDLFQSGIHVTIYSRRVNWRVYTLLSTGPVVSRPKCAGYKQKVLPEFKSTLGFFRAGLFQSNLPTKSGNCAYNVRFVIFALFVTPNTYLSTCLYNYNNILTQTSCVRERDRARNQSKHSDAKFTRTNIASAEMFLLLVRLFRQKFLFMIHGVVNREQRARALLFNPGRYSI